MSKRPTNSFPLVDPNLAPAGLPGQQRRVSGGDGPHTGTVIFVRRRVRKDEDEANGTISIASVVQAATRSFALVQTAEAGRGSQSQEERPGTVSTDLIHVGQHGVSSNLCRYSRDQLTCDSSNADKQLPHCVYMGTSNVETVDTKKREKEEWEKRPQKSASRRRSWELERDSRALVAHSSIQLYWERLQQTVAARLSRPIEDTLLTQSSNYRINNEVVTDAAMTASSTDNEPVKWCLSLRDCGETVCPIGNPNAGLFVRIRRRKREPEIVVPHPRLLPDKDADSSSAEFSTKVNSEKSCSQNEARSHQDTLRVRRQGKWASDKQTAKGAVATHYDHLAITGQKHLQTGQQVMLTRPVSQAASSAASEIEERLDSPVSVTLPEKSGAAFTLIPARLSFSVLVNQVASASLELRNTGTVAFTFLWTPEKTACDTSNDLFISNDEGILFLPADTAAERAGRLFCRTFKGIILPGNSERIQFSFRATSQGVYHGTWRLTLTPPGERQNPILVPMWAVVEGIDDSAPSVHDLEQRLRRRVIGQYIKEILIVLLDNLPYGDTSGLCVERANIRTYKFEHINSLYRVDGAEAIVKDFLKIREDLRAFKEALTLKEAENAGHPHSASSHHAPQIAHPGTEESLSLAVLFEEIFMLDSIHLEEKRRFALRLQILSSTAQEFRARYSTGPASLMESIFTSLVPACCSAIADARDRAGQPTMMPQWLPPGHKLRDESVVLATHSPERLGSQQMVPSSKPTDNITTYRLTSQQPHLSYKEGLHASRCGRSQTISIPDWQDVAAEVVAKTFRQHLEDWELDAVLSHANHVLLHNFTEMLDNTGPVLDHATPNTVEPKLEKMEASTMKLLVDLCLKADLDHATPGQNAALLLGGSMIPQKVKVSDGDERDRILAQVRKSFQVVEDIIRQSTQQLLVVLDSATAPNVLAIEDISFEVLTLICEENEATFRCLTSEEDIWDFIDEKLPEEWDSVRGPQVAEAAPETVVYFINHWSRFVYLALSFIYEKQIDKVEKEAVDAERDGSITALSGDRKPRQEYHGEKHISLLFHVLGVDTIVLDYFPSSDMDLPSSITTWQSLVPAKRILGPYIRRFLQNLCVFFGLELEGMRQAIVENYTETKDKLKRCYSFNSLADYTVDSIRRRIFAHKRSEPDSLANRKKRMVTIMTFYCDDFWDTDSVVAVNRITELMDLLEKVVTFSASTTIFLCGDICTVLLAFLFDGKVEVHSKAHDRDESLRSDDFDEGNNRYESSGACFAKADFVLPHVDRAAMVEGRLHAGEGTESMPSEVLVSCSDTGEASPGKATTAKKSEERFASRTSPSVTPHNMEGRQSSSIRRPQVEKSSRGRRGLVLMRKFPGWSKYAAIVAEAFKRILSTAERRQISLCFPRDILLRIENVRRAKEAPSQQSRKISGARYRQSQGDGTMSEKSPTSKPLTRKPLRRPLQASDESRPSTEHSSTGASVELPQPDTFLDGDENVVCCQLPPSTQMLSWFLRKWATPRQYPLEKDLRDEDNISEEVAIYWSAGPTLLRDLKEAILTSDILCYLGDALERYSERNSKSTYDMALPTACPTSCTAEFLSVLSVLLPSDQSPSGSVSAGSQNVDEVDDDSDVEEATTAPAPRRSSIVTQHNSAGAGNSLHLALLVGGIANEANCQGISADAINCLSNDEGTSFMRVCRGHHVQLLSPADSILLDLK